MTHVVIFYIAVGMFTVVMILNVIAFARHWRMMRALQIALNGLIESHRMYSELEQARRLPEGEREAAINAVIQRLA